jgi:hypothetical protein
MDTSSGLDTDSDSGVTYAAVEIDQPGWHEFTARALAAGEFGENTVPQTSTYILGSAPGAEIYSDSFARGINVLAWTPESETLPPGTSIVALYALNLDGILLSWGNNTTSAKTSVDLMLTAYDAAGTPLADLGGTASIEMCSGPGYPVEFIETGDLIGLFNWDGEDDESADVDAQLDFTFDAEIGTTYTIEVILTSTLYSGYLYESTAYSDFYESCTYQFTGAFDPNDVNFTNPLDVYMTTSPSDCFGDLNGDGEIGLSDLAELLSNYGTTSGATYEDGDLDGDGDVQLADLAALLAVYGTQCP